MLFVSIELITVTFTSHELQRGRLVSLEAGVKYLILARCRRRSWLWHRAVWGTTGKLNSTNWRCRGQLPGINLPARHGAGAGRLDSNRRVPFRSGAGRLSGRADADDGIRPWFKPRVVYAARLFTAIPGVSRMANPLIIISGITILTATCARFRSAILNACLGIRALHMPVFAAGRGSVERERTGGVLYYLSGYLFTVLGRLR